MKRNCPKPNCIRVADGSYCPQHNAEHDKKRGTKTQRGYDRNFYSIRRRFVEIHKKQDLTCWRCNKAIPIGDTFHLGHHDEDRTVIMGPECPVCNLSAAGKASHKYD